MWGRGPALYKHNYFKIVLTAKYFMDHLLHKFRLQVGTCLDKTL